MMPAEYRVRAMEKAWRRASARFPVLLLTGPRQVGKTTMLRHLAGEGRTYVTLDDPLVRAHANGDPATFFDTWRPPVLVDEIQYSPGLLQRIKLLVDADRAPGAFWLTGSQQFRAMRGITETLAGRVGIATLLGYSQREAEGRPLLGPFLPTLDAIAERAASAAPSDTVRVYERIWTGSFPAHVAAGGVAERDLFFGSYVQTYLERDVRDLAAVGSLDAFLRFLRAAAARTGQLLNLSELARDVDVSVPTARAWLSILEASFQVALVEPWHTNVTKRLVKTPKLHFLDTGLAAWLTRWSSPEVLAGGAMAGAFLESFVVAEILKSWWSDLRDAPAYFYRDHDGHEIDLLLHQDGRLHPVEVKRSGTPRSDWTRSPSVLRRLGEVGPGAVVCLAEHAASLGSDMHVVPVGAL